MNERDAQIATRLKQEEEEEETDMPQLEPTTELEPPLAKEIKELLTIAEQERYFQAQHYPETLISTLTEILLKGSHYDSDEKLDTLLNKVLLDKSSGSQLR